MIYLKNKLNTKRWYDLARKHKEIKMQMCVRRKYLKRKTSILRSMPQTRNNTEIQKDDDGYARTIRHKFIFQKVDSPRNSKGIKSQRQLRKAENKEQLIRQ